MSQRLQSVFRFAMPFLKASLIKQILAGLVLGILLAAFSLPQRPRQAFSVRCS